MSNQKSLKEEIHENKGKFKELSFMDKLHYIKDYYWLHIFIVILCILLAISIIKTIRDNDYETAINIIIANNTVINWVEEHDTLEAFIEDGFASYIGVDNKENRVLVSDYYLVADRRDSELSAINSQMLTAMFAGGQIDIYIGDTKAIDYFSSDLDPFFYNLKELLSPELYEQLADKMIYYTYEDGNTFPFAVDVTDTPFATAAGFVSEQVLVAIPDNTERSETAVSFVEYIVSLQ